MKAAILYQTNQPLEIENITWNTLEYGQVLVEIAYSGVCHSQLMEARGKRGEDKWVPHLLGHEATGIVKDIGPDVTKVAKGDRVVLGWIAGSGIDAQGALYQNGNKTINSGKVTTFSEYSVVSENRVVKLDNHIPLDVGVLFGCAIPTGAGIVINEIKPKKGTSIAILGLGGIGLSALMATKLYEFDKIIAIDIEESKLTLAKEFGANYTINSRDENVLEKIKELTNNLGVDYCVEATGLTSIIEMGFKVIKRSGGLCVFASHPQNGDLIKIDPFELICGKNIKGSWGGSCNPDIDLPKFFALYKEGSLPLEKILDKKYTLDEINTALDDLENRRVTRPLIVINENLG